MAECQTSALNAVKKDLQQKIKRSARPSTQLHLISVLAALGRGEYGPARQLYQEWFLLFSEQNPSFRELSSTLEAQKDEPTIGGCDGACV